MLLYIGSIIIFLFVSFTLFYHSSWPVWLKVAGTLAIFLISQKYVIYNVIGGAFFAPHMSRYVIMLLEALYGALIILFFLLVFWDIYLAGNWLLNKLGLPVPTRIPAAAIKACICLLALGIGVYGTWQAVKVPNVIQREIHVADLPPSLDGFSIVQLSDLHIGPILKKDWLEGVVQKVNSLNPDLVALTGDYVDGRVDELATELEPLAGLKARYGVFGVTGNHEYYWNAPAWSQALRELGVKLLSNSHESLKVNDENLVVAGVPDLAAGRFGMEGPDVEKALSGAPKALTLLLSHQPRLFASIPERVDLQLSGHTHGGIMFFLQPLIARFNDGFVVGQYSQGSKNLYVNPGTGLWNGFSCRIGVPPEITRIVLRGNSL